MRKGTFRVKNVHVKWTLIHLRGVTYYRLILTSSAKTKFGHLSNNSINKLCSTSVPMIALKIKSGSKFIFRTIWKWINLHFEHMIWEQLENMKCLASWSKFISHAFQTCDMVYFTYCMWHSHVTFTYCMWHTLLDQSSYPRLYGLKMLEWDTAVKILRLEIG